MGIFAVATERFGESFPVMGSEPDPSPEHSPAPAAGEIRSDSTQKPLPKKVIVFRCRECRQYDVDHGIYWCEQPAGWFSIERLFRCPGPRSVIELPTLQGDPYSKIFEEAVQCLAGSYPPDLMNTLRGESPELAAEIDAAYDAINEAWDGDLGRFREAVSEWAGLVGAGIACVRKRTPPRLAVESAEQVYTTGDI
jgi:hypothetical protein